MSMMADAMDEDEMIDDGDDFGQRLPPLHIYLKRVLDKYPDGPQILKELLQNADDAGAKKLIFLYDTTQHPTNHPWSQSLAEFSGPSLYVYNDATFQPGDWHNIQHPEQSGKHDDPTKVGRFGLGFISVYHLTDMPYVFSGTHVGILDPHERYFVKDPITGSIEKGKNGKKWRISSKLLEPELHDMFSPFINPLFDCEESDFLAGQYEGTVFRFPLRQDGTESKVSHTTYDDPKVEGLFSSFQDDAELSLLFLKNVESVAIYEKTQGELAPKLRFQIEVSEGSRSKLRSERSDFVKECRNFDESCNTKTSRCKITINTHLLQQSFHTNHTSQYLITNILKRHGLSKDLQNLIDDEDLKLLPWVGAAAKTSPVMAKEGRAFCFLPLPESEHIHLPIHVHGYFGLGDNRRSIKWLDPEAVHDKKAKWNQLLVEEVFPEVYVDLIMNAIDQDMVAAEVYNMWPEVEHLQGAWSQGMQHTITKLKALPILYTDVGNGSWKAPSEVYINTDTTTNNKLIQKVMMHQGKPVVQLPSNVLKALRWGNIPFDEVTPGVLREAIRNDTLQWLTRKEKMSLLDYILSDKKFTELENIHLLPLQNENFTAFSRCGEAVYVPSPDVPSYLFPNMESRLTSNDCPAALKSSHTVIYIQLSVLTVDMVPSLLTECLPREWVQGTTNVTWTPGLHNQPQRGWLKHLWVWLHQQVNISLHSFVSLPLIQLSISGNKVQLARLQVDRLIFQRDTHWNMPTELSGRICTFLESIGAVIIRRNLPSFIMQHREIKSFIKSGNGEAVMLIMEALWDQAKVPFQVENSTPTLKHDLAVLLSSVTLPAQWKKLLISIPIFKSSDGHFVSVENCSKGLPLDLHGMPVKKLNTCFIWLDDTSILAKQLEVKEVKRKTLLRKYVFRDIEENHFYNQKECDRIMTWALGRPELDDIIKDVEFIPTSKGTYLTARQLFDPTTKLKSLFKDQPVFPTGIYSTDRILHHLRRIGLRDESQISAKELLDIANAVSQSQDRRRSEALLKYICQDPSLLSSNAQGYITLGTALKDIPWVPCESTRPSSYPKTWPWFGQSSSLYCPGEVNHIAMANTLGSVVPLIKVKVCSEFKTYFGWTSKNVNLTLLDQVVRHLKNVTRSTHPGVHQHADSVIEIVSSIYSYLGKVSQELLLPHFSGDGILANEAWVWHGKGFTTPDKIALTNVIPMGNLVSYLHEVPQELHQHKEFLMGFGVRQLFTIQDYTNVLGTMEGSVGTNPLSQKELAIVQDIIKALLTYEDLGDVQSKILVPDSNSVLRVIEDLTYIDQVPQYPSEFSYAHHSITATQAKQLRIKTHRDIQLDECSTDNGFEHPFGQTEKLTTRLRGILREYSHKPDVLKELLQNADDAGASEIHMVYDPRRHKGTHISGPEWKPIHSAPAICFYNDKPFSDTDIEGIQNVGVGGKISDTTTTGRFGIGFNAVYHLTDCPTFLTQNKTKLCVFDPHVKYVPRATQSKPGKLYHKQGNTGFLAAMPDMLEGYLQEFDQFNLEKGTMFRFPLRSPGMTSEISDESYDDTHIYSLLSEFETVSKEALLFLKNIQKISISEINQNTGKLKLRYQVTVDITEDDKKQREELAIHLRSHKDVDVGAIPQMTRVYTMKISDSTSPRKNQKWLVSQTVGLDPNIQQTQPSNVPAHFMTKSYLPVGGVAAPIQDYVKSETSIQSGKAFCFLPLQINTNLNVHVNGTFVLDQSRRNLKTGDNKDTIHPWNQLLAEGVIGPAYASLIKEAGRILYKSSLPTCTDGQWSCWQYDKLFPTNLDYLQAVWRLVGSATLRYIAKLDMEVLPVVVEGSTSKHKSIIWCSPKPEVSNAYFDDLSKLDLPEVHTIGFSISSSVGSKKEKKACVVRNLLRRSGFRLISGSTALCYAFQKVKVEAKFISPEICLRHVRVSESVTHTLPCHISSTVFQTPAILETVLDYCSSGIQAVSHLQGLPFQLDDSGILDTFSTNYPKYITYEYRLLPSMGHLFIHRAIIGTLSKCLSQDDRLAEAYSTQLLKEFTIHELAKHMGTQLQPNWKGSARHVEWLKNIPDADWLIDLWKFICSNCKGKHITQIEALADWPIIPTTSQHLVSIKMAKTVLYLKKFDDTHERQKVCRVLQKLGCPIVNTAKMKRVSSSVSYITVPSSYYTDPLEAILTRYLATPTNPRDVLSVIQYMSSTENATLTGRLTPSECDTLLLYFQTSCDSLSRQDIMQLKQLPLFPLATSQHRVSIQDAVHCHTCIDVTSLPDNTEEWMQRIGSIFLDHNTALSRLYEKLGIDQIGMTEIYMYLLSELHLLSPEGRLAHIKFIRDKVLPNASTEDKMKLYTALKEIKFIVGSDGYSHEAAYYYDNKNPVFEAMIDPSLFLPMKFRKYEWVSFLKRFGLQHTVTNAQFIQFAIEIERGSDLITCKEQYKVWKSKSVTLSYDLLHNSQLLSEPGTLSKIAPIRFIAPQDIKAVKQDIHLQFSSTQGTSSMKRFICYKGSVPEEYKDLCWSVDDLIPSNSVPKKVHEIRNKEYEVVKKIAVHGCLGIQSEPAIGNVLQHIRNVCTRMADKNSHEKEDSLEADMRNELVKVVTKMMNYLNGNMKDNDDAIKEGLQDTPICLVDEGVILTRANQLVYEMPKNMENELRPYLYKAPRELAKYDKLLHLLGAEDETTFDQLAMVLKGINDECKDSKMNINDKKKAYAATGYLFRLLQSTEGKCPITVQELFLPTPINRLRPSTELYYTDLDEIESRDLPSSDQIEFVIPLKQVLSHSEVYGSKVTNNESGLIELLPAGDPCNLRPQKLSTYEGLLETNNACDVGMGHQCELVQRIKSIINSDDLEKVLLRLFYHHLKQAPDQEQRERISGLRDFDNILCMQELKTGFFDSSGKLLGERKISRHVFLAQDEHLEIHLAHTDVTEGASLSLFYLPLAESIDAICGMNLDGTHIGYLREVLPCSSKETNNFLDSKGIPEYEDLTKELGPLEERPGAIVPRDIWCLLDDDMSNKFHPGDIVVYNHPLEDGSGDTGDQVFYVYAKIIERLPMERADDVSVLRRYSIDIGEDEPIVVSVVTLFKFKRLPVDVNEESEELETAVTLYTGISEEKAQVHLPKDLKDAKKKIRKDVTEAFKLSDNERKECIRRLYRTWHPDKNPEQVLLATQAFQFLKQEIERQSGTHSTFEDIFSHWDFDIRRETAEQQHYRERSSHQSRSDGPFFPHSFTNQRPDPRNARLWYRQAEEDFKTAQAYHRKRVETSLAWPALMIQQAVEKALKAALFQLEGSHDWSHFLNLLVHRVCQHSQVEIHREKLQDAVTELECLGCHATRPRYPEDGTNRTTGEAYKDFKTMEALDLCKSIIEITQAIIGI